MIDEIVAELKNAASPQRAKGSARFFKTGSGEYGEGDIFIGITNPELHRIAKKYSKLSIEQLKELIVSPIHEYRFVSLMIMSDTFSNATFAHQDDVYSLYLWALKANYINNWDLVDSSAPHIVGVYLLDKPTDMLYQLASSKHLWSRRVAILSTFAFLKTGDATHTLKIATLLLHDKHDLIHKAVGWLLREVGKRNGQETLTTFLDAHAHEMPRTMLRYSLEKLSPAQRKYYMAFGKKAGVNQSR